MDAPHLSCCCSSVSGHKSPTHCLLRVSQPSEHVTEHVLQALQSSHVALVAALLSSLLESEQKEVEMTEYSHYVLHIYIMITDERTSRLLVCRMLKVLLYSLL